MDDSNVIAHLFAAEGNDLALQTIMNEQNKLRYHPPQGDTQYRSRESTVSLEDDEDTEAAASDPPILPYLELSFSSAPNGSRGFEIGTDKDCDVVLPKLPRISRVHCAITFDERRLLILRDFSKNGTVVEYDGQGAESRKVGDHFTWILGGHPVCQTFENIIIRIQGISFRIAVIVHQNENEYNTNVDRFLKQAERNLTLGRLDIQTIPSTVAPSGTQTPRCCAIRVKRRTLGKGAFAVASLYWDVSTGEEYVYKEPHKLSDQICEIWRKECEIMGRISHEHIVKLVEGQVDPQPRLILEYIPLGDLEGQNFSDDDSVNILRQVLSALSYLHELEHPLVHRDIKPNNLLVQSRQPLHVKLADFGLSKAGINLRTFCGTPLYLAPVVYRFRVYQEQAYTSAVDIWSLGVVVYGFTYGLPNTDNVFPDQGRSWCRKIIKAAKDCDSDKLVDFLLSAMLVIDPKDRHSARECYTAALQIPLPCEGRSITPTPISYSGEIEASSFRANLFGGWKKNSAGEWYQSWGEVNRAVGLGISRPFMEGQTYVLNGERIDLSWIGSSACTVTAPNVDNERLRKSSRGKPDKNETTRRGQQNRVSKSKVSPQRAHRRRVNVADLEANE